MSSACEQAVKSPDLIPSFVLGIIPSIIPSTFPGIIPGVISGSVPGTSLSIFPNTVPSILSRVNLPQVGQPQAGLDRWQVRLLLK